MEVTAGITT